MRPRSTPNGVRPPVERRDWQRFAHCQVMSAELFFAAEHEDTATRKCREDFAKAICSACPVQQPCRSHALTHREPYGVWGGTTERERGLERRSAATNSDRSACVNTSATAATPPTTRYTSRSTAAVNN
ncbi:WhiB family transcriptional regulator [Rhodococcus sp. B50]|uniref:WhiB family transcriptional regulator n=1 Tax=Rhodococcus sp. B50 TaxID=2682847 RepID=UPI001BD2FCC5|nr:WhiB family transcriptional regulator [Rhodococcus sp. B50]